ncbi:ABC-type transport auxiliary lipoprotein family protein [Orbaceae bacterium ESL0721]|nr:ABC-type transport auxiliary lipoprotein family protein [Orbaceae bacterium ESL0721]
MKRAILKTVMSKTTVSKTTVSKTTVSKTGRLETIKTAAKKLAAVTISLLLLASCSAKVAEKNYYQLADNLQISTLKPAQTVHTAQQLIFIEPIEVARFLDKNGIVLQTDAIKYITATQNLWIAPLSQQLEERIVQDFTQLLPNYIITSKPTTYSPIMRLKLFIDGFHGSYNGDAVIKGRWVIANSGGELYSKTFNRHIPLTKNGYESLVAALSKGWQLEEQDLANKLEQVTH